MRIKMTLLSLGIFMNTILSLSQIPVTGLVGYYPFSGNIGDSSGTGNHGTYINAVSSENRFGASGKAFYFNGSGNHAKLPCVVDSSSFTVIFWVKTSMNASNGQNWYNGNGMVDAEVCGYMYDWGISLIDGGKVAFGIGGSGTELTIKSTMLINDNTWHMIVGTHDTATGLTSIYIDGALNVSGTSHKHMLNAVTYLGVGNNPCDISYNRLWFNGSIDDIRIYNRVLDPAEVTGLYNENCPEDIYDKTMVFRVSDKTFEEINSVVYYAKTDTVYIHENCGCIRNVYYEFNYEENIFSDTIYVNDTIRIYDTTYTHVTIEDTLDIYVSFTATEPANIASHIIVFPNPTHDELNIIVKDFNHLSGFSVRIADSYGREVWVSDISEQDYKIDLHTFGGIGIFYLQIYDDNQVLRTEKVIRLIQ